MPAATDFHLFGPAHLAILIVVPVCAGGLTWITHRKPATETWTRVTLAALLSLSGVWWYWYRFSVLRMHLPQGLPFELCDVSLLLTIYSLLRLQQWSFELAYYWGLGGATMAVLTPDLLAPLLSTSSISFFIRHGGVIIALLYLLWSNCLRPRPRSWRFAFLTLNLYAAAIAAYDFLFGTNYLYLRNKPASASLLNAMGTWPLYIFIADVFALVLFLLMAVPFSNSSARTSVSRISSSS